MTLEPGTRVGPYLILAPLGAGGMGEVFRARDERLGREVAVKVLPQAVSGDPERLRRFEQEARTAGGLNDPNVLVVYDFGAWEGRPYLVTELLEGTNLRDRLREGPLPFRKALELGAQIARGLAAAHARGIVHRDIKPENLFLTRDGRVKILDFGVARTLEPQPQQGTLPLTGAGAVMGTAGYMSPEQVRGQPADARSDIFSFGAVLYELLGGGRAFDGETSVDRGYAILNKEPEPLSAKASRVPLPAEALVRRCLEKNPEERFQSARDLAFALEALTQTTSDGAGTISGGAPAPARPIRRRALLTGAAVAGPALFAGGYLTRGLRERQRERTMPAEAARQFTRLTFQPARLANALFTPEANTILFAAGFKDSNVRVYSVLPGQPGVRPLTGTTVSLAAVSDTSELALLHAPEEAPDAPAPPRFGSTLARMPLSGVTAQDVLEDVMWADFGPGGKLLAVRGMSGGFVLEYPVGNALVEDSGWLSWPRVSRSGDRIAYARHPLDGDDRGWIEVVDLEGRRERLSPEWYTLRGLAWSPDDRDVWFTGSEEVVLRNLYAVSMRGRIRPVLKVPSSIQVYDTAEDGRVLVARSSTRFKMMMHRAGWEEDRDLSLFDASIARDLSADGSMLLFDEGAETSRGDYDAYVRPTAGGAVVSLGKGHGLALSPDGKWAVLSHAPYEDLRLVPTGAGVSRSLNSEGVGRIVNCYFYPDGDSLLVLGRIPGGPPNVFRVRLDGSKPEKLLTVPTMTYAGPPSHDMKRIPIQTHDRGPLIASLTGGGLTPLALTGGRVIRFDGEGRVYFLHAKPSELKMEVGLFDPRTQERRIIRSLAPPEGGLAREFHGGAITENGAYAYTYAISDDELYLARGLS